MCQLLHYQAGVRIDTRLVVLCTNHAETHDIPASDRKREKTRKGEKGRKRNKCTESGTLFPYLFDRHIPPICGNLRIHVQEFHKDLKRTIKFLSSFEHDTLYSTSLFNIFIGSFSFIKQYLQFLPRCFQTGRRCYFQS